MDIDTTLIIQGGVFGAVGVLTSVKLLTSYFKKFFDLRGRWVMGMTLLLSAYAVSTAILSVYWSIVGLVFMGVYLTVLVATTADAYFQQEEATQVQRAAEHPDKVRLR
jgi:mannose/fructose/N-acetylgalactosamine-specific phosphotransferase system component IID